MISGPTVLPVLLLDLDHGLEDRRAPASRRSPDRRCRDGTPRKPSIGLNSAACWRAPRACGGLRVSLATRHFLDLGLGLRQELVQRRIEQADRDRQAGHDLEQLDEILRAASAGSWPAPRGGSFRRRPGSSRARRDAVALEEHVLGAAEADALGAELHAPGRASAGVSALVRMPSLRNSSAQPISCAEVAAEFGLDRRHDAGQHLTDRAVDA
jgi:AraC-like DNA-binding protein